MNINLFRRKTEQEKQDHREMVKQIVKSCMVSSCIVLVFIILFELFFYFNSVEHPKSFGNLLGWYRTCYLVLLFASVIGLIMSVFCLCSYDKRYRIMQWLSPVYCCLVVVWALSVTYLDCLKSNKCSPILFMTISLCIPACMYINPVFYFILDLAGSSVMLWMTVYAPGGGDSADFLNYLVFMIIQIFISVFFLMTRYGYYKSVRQSLINEQKARKAVEAKAATLSNMSHELRTPLNAIMGMNELIIRGDTEKNLEEYTDSIRVAGDTLLELINDMLDFSKLEAGKMTVNKAPYKLSQILDRVYNIMHVLADKKGLTFRIEVEENTPDSLKGDSQRISQLMINFINNAVKYTKKGSVTLYVGFDTTVIPQLCVKVVDTGIGIKEKDIPYLFDSFSRVDDEQNYHIEGTGLGLMICERFVHLMQGEIGVESTYGEGSTFWFSIPQEVMEIKPIERNCWCADMTESLAEAALTMEEENGIKNNKENNREKLNPSDKAVFLSEERPHVLVVDDTPMNIKIFVKLLEKEPLIVDTAESGEQCLSMIEHKEYDMIFLDHIMPEMNGIETLKRIRNAEPSWCRNVKVVALTANGGGDAREEYLQLGFDDYLSKPVSLQALLDIVAPLTQ